MNARSNEPPKKIVSGRQLVGEVLLTIERNLAKELGNSECLERWRTKKSFNSARQEWLDAWKRFAEEHGLGSLFGIHAGAQQTLEPLKNFILAMLRFAGQPEVTLRNQAAGIYAAALKGDVKFFREICLALRSSSQAQRESGFLAYNILRYWFAGRLWLMNDKAGWVALSAYVGNEPTWAAYRKARTRLGLNGHKDRAKSSLEYDLRRRIYKYAPGGTRLEPDLSI